MPQTMKTLNLTNSEISNEIKNFNQQNGSNFEVDFNSDNKRCYLYGGFSELIFTGQKFNRNTILEVLNDFLTKEVVLDYSNKSVYTIAENDTILTDEDGEEVTIEKGEELFSHYEKTQEFKILSKYQNCITRNSPQNSGLYQLYCDFSKNNYAQSFKIYTKEAVIDFYKRNSTGKILKITEFETIGKGKDYEKTKPSKGEWVEVENLEQVIEILNSNENIYKAVV